MLKFRRIDKGARDFVGRLRPVGRAEEAIAVPGRASYKAPKEVPMEERFETIEIKVAFLEKSLEELDDVVRGLSRELDESRKEIKWLGEKVLSGAGEGLAPVERA